MLVIAEAVPILGLVAAVGPFVAAIVAVVMLGPQRSKLVGESLGDAVEDLRNELKEVRADRDQVRVDLLAVRAELKQTRRELKIALARIDELGEETVA